jgi:bacterioferritin-associated ferredoxin
LEYKIAFLDTSRCDTTTREPSVIGKDPVKQLSKRIGIQAQCGKFREQAHFSRDCLAQIIVLEVHLLSYNNVTIWYCSVTILVNAIHYRFEHYKFATNNAIVVCKELVVS